MYMNSYKSEHEAIAKRVGSLQLLEQETDEGPMMVTGISRGCGCEIEWEDGET